MELNIEIKIPFGLCLMLRTGVLVQLLCLALASMALHVLSRTQWTVWSFSGSFSAQGFAVVFVWDF